MNVILDQAPPRLMRAAPSVYTLDVREPPLDWCAAVTRYVIHPTAPPDPEAIHVGFDPGQRNCGLCVVADKGVLAYQIRWGDFPTLADGIVYMHNLIRWYTDSSMARLGARAFGVAVIEGASHASLHGQAALAENRTAGILALRTLGYQVKVVPPSTIAKQVFGVGPSPKVSRDKWHAKTIWKDVLGPDAATAYACALLAQAMGRGA